MIDRKLMTALTLAIALAAGTWGMQRASAEGPAAAPAGPVGFKRTELQRHDTTTAGREAVMARGDFEPGAVVPRHSHPGEEVGYIVAGELEVTIEGKPPTTLKAGESFFVPANTIHQAKNAGKTAAVVVSTYIVEKGKPLASMAK